MPALEPSQPPASPPATKQPPGARARASGVFRRLEQRRVLLERPPWWGRLEARITIALVAIGILCVGASTYLVRLTVRYYDRLGEQQAEIQREAFDLVTPFYAWLAEAQRQAFDARTELLATQLGNLALESEAALEPALVQWLTDNDDALGVALERPDREAILIEDRELDPDQSDTAIDSNIEWIRVPVERPIVSGTLPGVEGPDAAPLGLVRVTWGVDPSIAQRYQRIGELTRDLGRVEVTGQGGEGRMVERNEVQRAVASAIGVASGLMLFSAVLAGILIARRTTRKVSDLSRVMREIASGNTSVRAPRLGRDELGQLAAAFNDMLDELELSRRRITYLQRIGAWQEMARRIAHEIKNPLTPIQLAVQQLREKDPGLDERFSKLLRESVEIVEDEVEALRRMVTSFSHFAKVPEVQLEPVTLARILVEFERAYGHLGSRTGSEREADRLEVVPPADPQLTVLGDRQLLKQVLVNMVENAALSIEEAGISPAHVRVSAGRVVGRELAYVVVDDNGPGIPVQRRDLVFEPYQTTREHGTGLGLAIVKKIVLDHGGEVFVGESELGGARFEIRIPLADR